MTSTTRPAYEPLTPFAKRIGLTFTSDSVIYAWDDKVTTVILRLENPTRTLSTVIQGGSGWPVEMRSILDHLAHVVDMTMGEDKYGGIDSADRQYEWWVKEWAYLEWDQSREVFDRDLALCIGLGELFGPEWQNFLIAADDENYGPREEV